MAEHDAPRRIGNSMGLVTTLAFTILLVGSDEMVLSPILSQISNAFRVSVSQAALAVSAYGLALALGAPVLARVGDRKGAGAALWLGLAGFVGASILCAYATSFLEFLLARFLSGLAAGLTVPSAYALAGASVSDEFRGQALGWVVSGWSWSFILGVPLATWVDRDLGWRWMFVSFGFVAILLMLFMAWSIKRRRLFLTNRNAAEAGERTATADLFRLQGVAALLTATFGNMFGFYGMYALFGVAWHLHAFASHVQSGTLLLAYGIGFATSAVTGRWADRWGRRRILGISLVALTAVILMLPYSMNQVGLVSITLFVWGVFQSLTVTLITASLSEYSEVHRHHIMGWYSFATNMAVLLAPATMGWLDVHAGYATVAMLCAVITAAASASAWLASKTPPRGPRESVGGRDRVS
ncbi:MFS transporter [Alicyclobacillus fructus]|uniref:MFS transporter n=1 Tax=Alicyclobacillus fructus TaxID=2816082 RepID=UPI001A8EE55F|nr:MFS transporter [Alicyclobacillus fructus]